MSNQATSSSQKEPLHNSGSGGDIVDFEDNSCINIRHQQRRVSYKTFQHQRRLLAPSIDALEIDESLIHNEFFKSSVPTLRPETEVNVIRASTNKEKIQKALFWTGISLTFSLADLSGSFVTEKIRVRIEHITHGGSWLTTSFLMYCFATLYTFVIGVAMSYIRNVYKVDNKIKPINYRKEWKYISQVLTNVICVGLLSGVTVFVKTVENQSLYANVVTKIKIRHTVNPGFLMTFLRSTNLLWTGCFAYLLDRQIPTAVEVTMSLIIVMSYLVSAGNLRLNDLITQPLLINLLAPVINGLLIACISKSGKLFIKSKQHACFTVTTYLNIVLSSATITLCVLAISFDTLDEQGFRSVNIGPIFKDIIWRAALFSWILVAEWYTMVLIATWNSAITFAIVSSYLLYPATFVFSGLKFHKLECIGLGMIVFTGIYSTYIYARSMKYKVGDQLEDIFFYKI